MALQEDLKVEGKDNSSHKQLFVTPTTQECMYPGDLSNGCPLQRYCSCSCCDGLDDYVCQYGTHYERIQRNLRYQEHLENCRQLAQEMDH